MYLNRYTAGATLAQKLLPYRETDVVVYGLPRGGLLTALEVVKVLNVPLDFIITRKIGHPFNREYAVCAINEYGERICSEAGLVGVDHTWVDFESTIQQREVLRRRLAYQGTEKSISARGKVAIIVDDGIATGLTVEMAIRTLQKQKPKKIIVATPVAPHDVVVGLQQLVDEVVVLKNEYHFRGNIAAYYTHFEEVSDEQVIATLQEAKRLYAETHKRNLFSHFVQAHALLTLYKV